MNTLAEQLADLTQAYVEFVEIANQLDPQKRLQPGVCGAWSPKDMVAHLVGWDSSLLAFITDPNNFDPPYDVEQFNQQSVAQRKTLAWSDAMREMAVMFHSLQQAVADVTPEMQIHDRVLSWLAGRSRGLSPASRSTR